METYNFGERLKELMVENELSVEEVCKQIGVTKPEYYRWWTNSKVPSVENAIKLAQLFRCSVDYLTCRADESTAAPKEQVPKFSDRLKTVLHECKTNPYRISRTTALGRTSIHEWLRGDGVPSLPSLITLADALDCSLDYLLFE